MSPITVEVDLLNPGQFFACCGLLELADRLWPGSEGWFDGSAFYIVVPEEALERQPLAVIVAKLADASLNVTGSHTDVESTATAPLEIGPPFCLRLDHWLGGDAFSKTWAGNQKALSIARKMQAAIGKFGTNTITARILAEARPMTGRFGYDARAGWTSLDVGYSPNAQEEAVQTYPAVELLAAIGLQGFRPQATDSAYEYYTWCDPLPVPVARAACSGGLPSRRSEGFRFRSVARGNYKTFGFVSPRSDIWTQ